MPPVGVEILASLLEGSLVVQFSLSNVFVEIICLLIRRETHRFCAPITTMSHSSSFWCFYAFICLMYAEETLIINSTKVLLFKLLFKLFFVRIEWFLMIFWLEGRLVFLNLHVYNFLPSFLLWQEQLFRHFNRFPRKFHLKGSLRDSVAQGFAADNFNIVLLASKSQHIFADELRCVDIAYL